MKKKNIFDILENTDDETMGVITDLSPELDEAKFEKLFAKSEKDYKIKKKEMERTMRENIIEENAVSGVDRVRRPMWIRSMVTAASIVLIAGVVIGSAVFMHGGSKITNKGGGGTPTVTAVTTDKKSTETTAADTTSVKTTTTSTQTVTTVSTSAQEKIAETNVQVVGVQETNVTTASNTSNTNSQDETFVGRINQNYQENYRNVITKYIDEAVASGEDFCIDYVLKDVTGDGTPELILKHGHYEADSFVTIYNSDLKVIGDMFRGSYTGFYESSNGTFAFVTAHMGYFCASYPVYDAASDQLTIGTQNEKDYGAYGSWEDIDVLLQEEGLTAMNVVSISVDRGSVTSYYSGQTFDYPYFGIII